MDFNTTGRRDGSFSDLASNLGREALIYEASAPDWVDSSYRTMSDYIDFWLGENFPVEVETPVHIIGHCAGSTFSPNLADALFGRGYQIGSLIAVDPAVPTVNTIGIQFWQQIESYKGALAVEEVVQIQGKIKSVVDCNEDVETATGMLSEIAAAAASKAYANLGVGDRLLRDYLRELRRYTAFLVAASQADPLTFLSGSSVITSESQVHGTAALRDQYGRIETGSEYYAQCSHELILSDLSTSRKVIDLIKSALSI
ncbi:hypothetical protein [Nocardia salmonicida]|uniref:hypothetical protein n=1 Tax=Nocardia salmonicida TaxID=53431 RepID=UPI0010420DE8|nr:hypothetical protein [Nocardia salmonicida]